MNNYSSEGDNPRKAVEGKFKAALVDLDGLLINSEELSLEANRIYFKREFNFEFSEDLHRAGTGRRFEEWINTVIDTNKSGEEILQERNQVYFDLAEEKLKLMPGARGLLEMLKKHFKLALVSTSRKDYVELVLELTGIDGYFDVIVTGDDVQKAKPDPEPYLVAARKLGIETGECIVFEDAPTGVMSAKSASMKVVAVPSKFVKGDVVFEQADLVLSSLTEVDLHAIKSLS